MMKYMNKIFPCEDFWKNFLKKFFSFFVSFKFYVVSVSTILLLEGFLSSKEWATTVVSITLGRVVIETVSAYKDNSRINITHSGE